MPEYGHIITRADIIDTEEFAKVRKQRRAALKASKALRRIDLGRDCCFYFESYQTMLFQIQEMLYIEKGGEAQIEDELNAYNPLVPNGNELVATMMFEIDEPARRAKFLSQLGGIENHIYLQIGDDKIYALPEEDTERTTSEGKTSSVHFFHFPLTPARKKAFIDSGHQVILCSDHPKYSHMSVLSRDMIEELSGDLDNIG